MSMSTPADPPGLWERSRRRAYQEIRAIALDLFLAQGFAETTIDEIAAAAGISRRSLFRYFGTKEDIVLSGLSDKGAEVRAALEERPGDEDIWIALHAAMVSVEEIDPDPQRVLAISRMLYEVPSLRARSLEKHMKWQEQLVGEVARRIGGSGAHRELRAAAIVACVIACLDVAGEAWTRDGGTAPLEDYLDAAMHAVRPDLPT